MNLLSLATGNLIIHPPPRISSHMPLQVSLHFVVHLTFRTLLLRTTCPTVSSTLTCGSSASSAAHSPYQPFPTTPCAGHERQHYSRSASTGCSPVNILLTEPREMRSVTSCRLIVDLLLLIDCTFFYPSWSSDPCGMLTIMVCCQASPTKHMAILIAPTDTQREKSPTASRISSVDSL